MERRFRKYAIGIVLTAASGATSALPLKNFSVDGASGVSGPKPVPVTVTLRNNPKVNLFAVSVVIDFDTGLLDYVSSAPGDLFSGSSPVDNPDEANGRVMVSIAPVSNDKDSGSLLAVNFNIVANALPPGVASALATVTFRCLPFDDLGSPVEAVTEANADQLCAPDYGIPPISGNVQILNASVPGQAPIAGTLWLTMLGFGLMACLRRKGIDA